jgi:hypothetical protein
LHDLHHLLSINMTPPSIQAQVSQAWEVRVAQKEGLNRWTLCQETNVPVRQRQTRERTSKERPVDIHWSERRSSWRLRRPGKSSQTLVLMEDFVEKILQEWMAKSSTQTRRDFVAEMTHTYAGVTTSDVNFVVTEIKQAQAEGLPRSLASNGAPSPLFFRQV